MSSSPLINSFLIDLLSPGIQTRMEREADTSAIILSPVSVSLIWRISLSCGTPDLVTKKASPLSLWGFRGRFPSRIKESLFQPMLITS